MALDMVHSLIIDEPDGLVDRYDLRWKVQHELDAPLDPDARREYERDAWGLSPEAIRAAERVDKEAAVPTYGEPEDE